MGSTEYSVFELTWRTVFSATALAVFTMYSYALRCGCGQYPGSGARIDTQQQGRMMQVPQRRRLRPTPEQMWVWVISMLLVAFNNPFFVYQVRRARYARAAPPTRGSVPCAGRVQHARVRRGWGPGHCVLRVIPHALLAHYISHVLHSSEIGAWELVGCS